MDTGKKQEVFVSFLFIGVAIVLFYFSYIDMSLPPQMGWWNYYGWRLFDGDILYKDLYCYLPPYVPFYQALLYMILGNSLFSFQVLGIFFVIFGGLLSYSILCKFVRPYYSAISVITGTVVAAGFPAHFPFDYNPIMLLIMIVLAYSAAQINTHRHIYIFIGGLSTGVLLMFKQTMIAYIFMIAVWFICFRFSQVNKKLLLKQSFVFFIAFCLSLFPALYYLMDNNVFHIALQEILLGTTAKGYSSGIIETIERMIFRYIENGFSISNISLAFILCYRYFIKRNIYVNLALCNLLIFKFIRIVLASIPMNVTLVTVIAIVILLFNMAVAWYCKVGYRKELNIQLNTDKYLLSVIFSVLICETLLGICRSELSFYVYSFGNGQFFFLLKRAFSEISFYFSMIVIMGYWCGNKCFFELKEEVVVFITFMCFSQLLLFAGSGNLDEAFSMPTVAFLSCVILSNEKNLLRGMVLVFFSLVIIVSIMQKQVEPYSWHGWKSVGVSNEKKKFLNSQIDALRGYKLDVDTETAYENVVDAILTYTSAEDIVYEYPHSPLFNCITERKLGTFAVSHFIDVCPDDILLRDLELIKEKNPSMFIYVKLDEGAWWINEKYYRNGRFSARKEVEKFYNQVIEKKYTLVYKYKNIYVWVKNDNNYQNFIYALTLLKNYATNYEREALSRYVNTIDISSYNYVINDKQKWSINDCVREIIKGDTVIYDGMTDEDYKKLIMGINNRISGVPAAYASFSIVKEE